MIRVASRRLSRSPASTSTRRCWDTAGPAELEVRGDLPGGELVVADEAEDLAPVGLGDGSEGGVHTRECKQILT